MHYGRPCIFYYKGEECGIEFFFAELPCRLRIEELKKQGYIVERKQ